ncbi:polysaccharide deacetylase family protein [Azospirillum argentinense]|uniref:polysaccharide deacetylase family protein n=1 Tax=Azospirillum argentinense TaxID=2970906 RepID=UPI001FFEDB4E|nr:polysaccharide deacetylase family protein [Azospirillum argentinense]
MPRPRETRPPADSAQLAPPRPGGDGKADVALTYPPEAARTMAAIEKSGRRKGRLGAVVPDTTLDVMPATLKEEGWNLCALTFDDGPHRVVTRQILDVLNREKIPATYFPVASVAENQGEVIRDFIAAGHEIGNHSLTHADLRAMDPEAQRHEIAEANRILRGFGANPVLFRPPYGRYTPDLLAIAREESMSPVLWTVDTRDWQVRDPDRIVQHVKTEAGTGSVLLLHSTYPSTLNALPRVIAAMRAKGCEFVTLSEWIERMHQLATPAMAPTLVNAGVNAAVKAGGKAGDAALRAAN